MNIKHLWSDSELCNWFEISEFNYTGPIIVGLPYDRKSLLDDCGEEFTGDDSTAIEIHRSITTLFDQLITE